MKQRSFYMTLDVWFVSITLVYWVLVFLGIGFGLQNETGAWWANALGLFVPFGPNSIALFAQQALLGYSIFNIAQLASAIGALLIVVATLAFGEGVLNKWRLPAAGKAIANLATLAALTFIVDILLTGQWMSLTLLQRSLAY